MTLQELREKLKNENIAEVSRISGVSRPSLMAIRDGFSRDIKIGTMERLTAYFNNKK